MKEIELKRQKDIEEQFNQLGSKLVEKVFRKLYMRKFSQNAQKMVFFDYQFLIGIPRWASFKDTLYFVSEYMQGLKRRTKSRSVSRDTSKLGSHDNLSLISESLNQENLKISGLNSTFFQTQKQPYVVHFIDRLKNTCYFCQKQLQPFNNLQQIKSCCQPEQKDVPLFWAGKQKLFTLFVDWVQMQQYNQNYCNQIQIDSQSMAAQRKMMSETITLESCLDLWKKPETIEMECEKCKFKQHLLETSIKKAPIITIFHLKEFRYTQQGHFVKLNINLQWKESIDLQRYCTNNKSSVYEMYSVVEHKGNTNSGHYTCLSKRRHPLQKKKVWVNFDDENAQIITQKPQSIQNAYLLFFKKVDIPNSAIVHFSI